MNGKETMNRLFRCMYFVALQATPYKDLRDLTCIINRRYILKYLGAKESVVIRATLIDFLKDIRSGNKI